MKLLGFFRRRREEKAARKLLVDSKVAWGKTMERFNDALKAFHERMASDLKSQGINVATHPAPPPSIPVAVWMEGRMVSHPQARVQDPPPEVLDLRKPRAYRSIEDVVNDLTGEPQVERFVLRYVGKDPRVAVYLHEAEVLAMKEGA